MSDKAYFPMLHVTRGEVIESIHYGAAAVVDAQGRLFAWYGDPQLVTYLRSSAKPFQALPFYESGGQQYYGLTPKEIALTCASHSGTDEHAAVVRGIQAKVGMQESDLLCGVHPPIHKETADRMFKNDEALSANRHNCSGKHTGMIAYARMLNLPYRLNDQPYIDPEHPIQQTIRKTFAEMCGLPYEQVNIGIDGCSAPNFAVPLYNAALGYARLCDPAASNVPISPQRAAACKTIASAMSSHPEMVGGPTAFDTQLMKVTGSKLVCKGGAEGYQTLGLLPGALGPGSPALGLAFKVSDGDLNGRARPAITLEILRQLGAVDEAELAQLAKYGPSFDIFNFRKLRVGQLYPAFTLQFAGKS